MNKAKPVTILLIEDEENISSLIPKLIKGSPDHNREFHIAPSIETAMHAIETGSFQAIVLDDTIHGGRSVDGLIQAIRQKLGIEVGMIMISSDNSHKQMEVGGENCVEISKPFGSEKIQQLNAELSRMLKPFEYPEE